MLKISVFTMTLVISICSFASSNLRRLNQVKSCELVVEEGAVFAGQEFSVFLKIQLKNGSTLYSNVNNRIGFNDFKIMVNGAKITEPTLNRVSGEMNSLHLYDARAKKMEALQNRQLDLASDFDLIDKPFVLVRAQLIDYPEIACELTMPVHFNGKYQIYLNGAKGLSGEHGRTSNYRPPPTTPRISPRTSPHVYKENLHGLNGSSGLIGGVGKPGKCGENGQDMAVYISLVNCQFEEKQLVKVEVSPYSGETYTRYLEKDGKILITANGGDGGNGGNGGDGGDGKNGGDGKYKHNPLTGECISFKSGRGGHGGNGGKGGSGGHAGHGGNGGDVNVFIEKDALFFKEQIFIRSSGGNPGSPGEGGYGGSAGKGGDGGLGMGRSGNYGKNGLAGDYGEEGSDGEINYFIWN